MLIKTASFNKLGKDFFRVFIFVTTIEYTISGRIDYMGQRKKVIIIGGGFGGIFTARKLANHNIDVLLIDKQNHHLFQPLLYQVAAGILSPENVAIPLRLVFADNKNVKVRMEEVLSVDRSAQKVVTKENEYFYDFLVIATGSTYNFFGHSEWAKHVFTLKTLAGALKLKNHIQTQFERALISKDSAEKERLLTFAIVGAGPTGVEMAGIISEIAKKFTQEESAIKFQDIKVNLIETAERPLAAFSTYLSDYSVQVMHKLGIQVKLNTTVEEIQHNYIKTSEGEIHSNTIIWAAGVLGVGAANLLNILKPARGNKVTVNEYLNLFDDDKVFVIGDTAELMQNDRPLPGLGSVAKQQGIYLGRALRKIVRGEDRREIKPFKYEDYGIMAIIGKRAAVAELPLVHLQGAPAWILWGLVHLLLLIGFRNRAIVLFDWVWTYLAGNYSSRVINQVNYEA
ncbi:MAG: NAD(P)/FAD-dependent oxidoreductase [Proteobacteria bacterium]|nr:NAD(P)/FAD-dependent oxidoreductase [Pseudomonadota bacterium]